MSPKTFHELIAAIYEILPNATFDEHDGEITVYTGLQETGDGNLSEYTFEEE